MLSAIGAQLCTHVRHDVKLPTVKLPTVCYGNHGAQLLDRVSKEINED